MLIRSSWRGERLFAPFVASVVLGFPYAHYAFSRADIYHLALGIFPLLVGSLGVFSRCRPVTRNYGTIIWLIVTSWTIFPSHPGWIAYRAGNWPTLKLGTGVLVVDPATAGAMNSVRDLVAAYAFDGRDFLITPFWPGAYAAFGRKSPTWGIYALLPQSNTFQEEEIGRLKQSDLGFVLIYDYALDGNEANRFRNTHPIVDQFIRMNYSSVNSEMPDNPFRIYVAKRQPSSTIIVK
jgi:hypothetical protein